MHLNSHNTLNALVAKHLPPTRPWGLYIEVRRRRQGLDSQMAIHGPRNPKLKLEMRVFHGGETARGQVSRRARESAAGFSVSTTTHLL